ncbi:MAG: hypothetical protein COB76_01275 [Alphaproteobacteria bacterium]|nr:MAG: hypothetical protein COB76_01275 [Alphaproteobacteria bacterium]
MKIPTTLKYVFAATMQGFDVLNLARREKELKKLLAEKKDNAILVHPCHGSGYATVYTVSNKHRIDSLKDTCKDYEKRIQKREMKYGL